MIEAARETGCDCVHPGYGFLAENAEFARRCLAEGPGLHRPARRRRWPCSATRPAARELASAHGVPIVPGSQAALADAGAAAKVAGRARLSGDAEGGGRRRRARHARVDGARASWPAAFARCPARGPGARSATASLFIEKLIDRPRHIEVQVLADRHGDVVHLYERDCSMQLRNQKLVEIAPAPNLDAALRAAHPGRRATRSRRPAAYVNAGTVEFLVDPDARRRTSSSSAIRASRSSTRSPSR